MTHHARMPPATRRRRHRLSDQPALAVIDDPAGPRPRWPSSGGGHRDPGSRDPARRRRRGPDGRDRRGLGLARTAPAGVRLHADGPAGRLRRTSGRSATAGPSSWSTSMATRRRRGARDPQAPRRPLHQLLRPVRDRGARPAGAAPSRTSRATCGADGGRSESQRGTAPCRGALGAARGRAGLCASRTRRAASLPARRAAPTGSRSPITPPSRASSTAASSARCSTATPTGRRDAPDARARADPAGRLRDTSAAPTDRPVHWAWPVEGVRVVVDAELSPVASSPPHAAAPSSPSGPDHPARSLVEEPHVPPLLRTKRQGRDESSSGPRRRGRPAGDTETVRRIVTRLEAMPPEQARLSQLPRTPWRAPRTPTSTSATTRRPPSSANSRATVARRSNGSPRDRNGEAPGEDRRWHRRLRRDPRVQGPRRPAQRLVILRACFAVMAANGTTPRGDGAVNEIADELDIDEAVLRHPRRIPRAALVGPADRRVTQATSGAPPARHRAMRAAIHGVARSLRAAIANPAIRRVEAAYTVGIAGDWVLLVALLVVAYGAGGALGVGILGLVRMVPATLTGTFAGIPAAGFGSGRVLVAANALRSLGASGVRSASGSALRRAVVFLAAAIVHRRDHGPARPVRPAAVPRAVAGRAGRGQRRVEPRRGRSGRSSGRCSGGYSSHPSASRRGWRWPPSSSCRDVLRRAARRGRGPRRGPTATDGTRAAIVGRHLPDGRRAARSGTRHHRFPDAGAGPRDADYPHRRQLAGAARSGRRRHRLAQRRDRSRRPHRCGRRCEPQRARAAVTTCSRLSLAMWGLPIDGDGAPGPWRSWPSGR